MLVAEFNSKMEKITTSHHEIYELKNFDLSKEKTGALAPVRSAVLHWLEDIRTCFA
jgi:hypothetical protein